MKQAELGGQQPLSGHSSLLGFRPVGFSRSNLRANEDLNCKIRPETLIKPGFLVVTPVEAILNSPWEKWTPADFSGKICRASRPSGPGIIRTDRAR